ncbi:hypothetical protein [Helicobacter pylori]|uniref:hypothetical protein n=1 Tax=Helicobacter pylori TaxID=210 RepID=UPI0012AC9695|nr:hypothetical protein [Helicobacter pylori]
MIHSASVGCCCFFGSILMSSCDRKSLYWHRGGLSRCFNEAIGRACGVEKRSSFHIGLISWF